jgi:hypothetical protein
MGPVPLLAYWRDAGLEHLSALRQIDRRVSQTIYRVHFVFGPWWLRKVVLWLAKETDPNHAVRGAMFVEEQYDGSCALMCVWGPVPFADMSPTPPAIELMSGNLHAVHTR